MENSPFIANSAHMQEIKKLANLVKTIKVNTIITGERGVGKTHIARFILPTAPQVDAENYEAASQSLKSFDEIIIENFDRLKPEAYQFIKNQKIVATTEKKLREETVNRFFGINIDVLPLRERPEDIAPMAKSFLIEAKQTLGIEGSDIEEFECDLSQNSYSLKLSAFKAFLFSNLSKQDIEKILEDYLLANIDVNENYKEFLKLFDRAVIGANYKKYKSQLMMSEKMGINRNTLRKKIKELGIIFDGDE